MCMVLNICTTQHNCHSTMIVFSGWCIATLFSYAFSKVLDWNGSYTLIKHMLWLTSLFSSRNFFFFVLVLGALSLVQWLYFSNCLLGMIFILFLFLSKIHKLEFITFLYFHQFHPSAFLAFFFSLAYHSFWHFSLS